MTYEEAGYEEGWSADEIAQQLIDDFSFNSDQIEILLNNSTDEESDGYARVAISGRDVGEITGMKPIQLMIIIYTQCLFVSPKQFR